MRPIGQVTSPHKTASEVPKGLGARHTAEGCLEILPELEAGLTDIEGFSHLIVLWVFDRVEARGETNPSQDAGAPSGPGVAWTDLSVAVPLLGTPPSDNRPHGVFATRSPRRPNPIALTVVELLGREGPRLRVRGIDMLDGTPILDIKPYLSNVPEERLRRGWLAEAEARKQAGA
jgi:tRNA (Thr-GGU) A37 N-methylase